MPIVHLLDEQTANQIAAGEVVERPAAAVKELAENSLDAGATRIVIEIEDGGRALIRVTDNGCGMDPEDAGLALQRHATSKIASADDLTRLRTLGFRGEALPSIASVSRFELITRPPDRDSATRIALEGGRILERTETGAPPGTRITVRHLFFNTPARLKFIKSVITEFNHIADVTGRIAMASPGVAIRLLHNNREIYSTPGSGNPRDALAALWGRDRAVAMLEARAEWDAATVTGFVSPPEMSRPNRSHQAFFVNGRTIASRLITHAVDQSFRPLLPDGRFAAAVLFLETSPEDVDVNVHPSKTEVRFRDERLIHSVVSRTVRSALMQAPSISRPPEAETAPRAGLLRPPTPESPRGVPLQKLLPSELLRGRDREEDDDSFRNPAGLNADPHRDPAHQGTESGPERPENASTIDGHDRIPADPAQESGGSTPGDSSAAIPGDGMVAPAEPGDSTVNPSASPDYSPAGSAPELLDGMRVLGQVMNTFIVGEGQDGLILIDQHVAHERILYDRLSRARDHPGSLEVQRLLLPLTVTLSPREASVLEERIPELIRLGFDLEPFGGGAFLLRALPADLDRRDPAAILRDLAAELNEDWEPHRSVMERAIDAVIASAACHGAIKANMPLGSAEIAQLLRDLRKTDHPFHCPHGRPIIVRITATELLKWFKRLG